MSSPGKEGSLGFSRDMGSLALVFKGTEGFGLGKGGGVFTVILGEGSIFFKGGEETSFKSFGLPKKANVSLISFK
mgnify:CR=1 FL=1